MDFGTKGFIFGANDEAWQPDPGAQPRWEDKDLNQGSQSTRNGIGLAIADVFAPFDGLREEVDRLVLEVANLN